MKKLKILVPTDFSEISNKALIAADKLAKLTDGRVTPLYAFEKTRYDGADTTHEHAKADLHDLARRLVDVSHLDEPVVSTQKPLDAIVDLAKNFDLVMMSSHGRTGISRLMLGSVTEKVIRLCKPPVLIVKNEDGLFPLESILVTTDFSENARNSFALAAALAELTGARIHVLYAVTYHSSEPTTHLEAYIRTKEKQFRTDLDKYFSKIADRVTFKAKLTKKSASEYLSRHIQDNPYNLIVMATLGRSGLEYLKMGSTTASVVRNVDTNVLITNTVNGQ